MADIYEFEMTKEDIGEIVEMIRISYLRLNEDAFCKKVGVSNSLLFQVEQGRGAHGLMLMRKIHDTFPNVKVKMSVEIS